MSSQSDSSKKTEVLCFLHERVFDPILNSQTASISLKRGIQLTINRMNERDAEGIVHFYWSAISGTGRSSAFEKKMRQEGFTRFEDIIDEFRDRFDARWFAS